MIALLLMEITLMSKANFEQKKKTIYIYSTYKLYTYIYILYRNIRWLI